MPSDFFRDVLIASEMYSAENLKKMNDYYGRNTMIRIGLRGLAAKKTLESSRSEFNETIAARKVFAKDIKKIIKQAEKLKTVIQELPDNKYEAFYEVNDPRSDWSTFDRLVGITNKPDELNFFDTSLLGYIELLSARYESVKIPAHKPRLLDSLTSFVGVVILMYENVSEEKFTIYEHRPDGEITPMTKGHKFVSKFCELISMDVGGSNETNLGYSYSASQIYTACKNARKKLQEKSKQKIE
ncbi:MAG: hypothetical protein COB36_13995 [Alphaproteobacteria bacterium]|nr:MAG: hypothetical protein COB36_13995 [Alphaproteobacteria bacterium]